ncbi:MAG: hypothetical protein AAB840_02670 [Patescibacteria group bacterium]
MGNRKRIQTCKGARENEVLRWGRDDNLHSLVKTGDGFLHTIEMSDGMFNSENITKLCGIKLMERVLRPDSECWIDPRFVSVVDVFYTNCIFGVEESVVGSSLAPVRPDCGHRVGPRMTLEEEDAREMFREESHFPDA